LFAVRAELMGRLQSSGVRPALKGTSHGAKIPLGDAEWAELEELAAAISVPGLTPTAGQIASVLLTLSVKSVISQIARVQNSASSSLAHDLATRSVGEPAKHQTLPDM